MTSGHHDEDFACSLPGALDKCDLGYPLYTLEPSWKHFTALEIRLNLLLGPVRPFLTGPVTALLLNRTESAFFSIHLWPISS